MEEKKKLIAPHLGYQKLVLEPFYGEGYQLFCPNCKFGPVFSKELVTTCNVCNSKLSLKRMLDGTYKVSVIK